MSAEDWFTNYMEQRPSWEANSHSTSQEIPLLLWNLKVCYVHKIPVLHPIQGHMHPLHTFPPCFPKNYSNTIVPSIPRSYEWSIPFRFSDQNFVCISCLPHACLPCPSHSPWFHHHGLTDTDWFNSHHSAMFASVQLTAIHHFVTLIE